MKKLKQDMSKDHQLTISGSTIQSSTSRREYSIISDAIPIDLLIKIFLRVPTESIARCRFVSKLWSSILRGPDFTKQFMTMSLACPRLLFAFKDNDKLFFFSTPQPQNPNNNSSDLVVANHQAYFPAAASSQICRPVNGLVCIQESKRSESVSVISNLTTRESLTLPEVKTETLESRSYFGYDPIGKEFKVLSITWPLVDRYNSSKDHGVLTLGKKQQWRKIKFCIPHYPWYDGICINGVLYYPASVLPRSIVSMIVRFDVRLERFSFIKIDQDMEIWRDSTLINYCGKLGVLQSILAEGEGVNRFTTTIMLWILEDAEKHLWSKNIYKFPSTVNFGEVNLYFVGVIGTGEIVLSPYFIDDPFYVFYYNPKTNTVQRVQIRGLEAFKLPKVHTFIDFVENMTPMQGLTSS